MRILNKTSRITIFFMAIIAMSVTVAYSQKQKGSDINGMAPNIESGRSVSMPDANTIAIGSPDITESGNSAGLVRVYSWNGSKWVRKGADINGESQGDWSGWSVSMPDANTIAIGAPYNSANAYAAGQVRIYTWSSGKWVQKGADIDGKILVGRLGWSVNMPDSNTVAMGAPWNGEKSEEVGHVQIYTWNGKKWVQKGENIEGQYAKDYSGWKVSMPDANTVAIGVPYSNKNLHWTGYVYIYSWDGNEWVQKGSDIDGELEGDHFGWSVSMPDANTVAIGSPRADVEEEEEQSGINGVSGVSAGRVRIYTWNGSDWFQKGRDINGEGAGDSLGYSVSMPDVNTVAVGAPRNSAGSDLEGQVRVYSWNGSQWIQRDNSIEGEEGGDYLGWSVSMPDANTVGIGAPFNDGNDYNSGHARVYSFTGGIGGVENNFTSALHIFPNPTKGELNIDLGSNNSNTSTHVVIRNVLGQEIERKSYVPYDKIKISIDEPSGIYFVEVSSDGRKAILKVIKE